MVERLMRLTSYSYVCVASSTRSGGGVRDARGAKSTR